MREPIGCLLIDELKPGANALAGLHAFLESAGIRAARFEFGAGRHLLDGVRSAYYDARRGADSGAIVGLGSGCCAALAVAEHLPVSRLVLIVPPNAPDFSGLSPACRRQITRMESFSRRNAAFCVSDVLHIRARGGEGPALRLPNARTTRLSLPYAAGFTNTALFDAVFSFLHTGELRKSLAENPEMCIIYG